jgi:hypothetical protein
MAYDGYYLTYKSDIETQERFEKVQEKYPSFRMVKINLEDWSDPKLEQAISKIASISNTKHFWIVDADVKVPDDFNFDYETDDFDKNITHLWNCKDRNVFRSIVGVKLFKTIDVKNKEKGFVSDAYYLTGEHKIHEDKVPVYDPTKSYYEIFLWNKSYGKKEAEKLKEKYGKRITEVTGETSVEVHEKCREITKTDYYYLVMPNTTIYEDFKFDYSLAMNLQSTAQKIVLWQKENPETKLGREYHGVGLFPTKGKLFSQKEYDIFNFRKNAIYEKEPASSDLEFEVKVTNDLHTFDHECDSDMYWLVHEDVEDFTTNGFYPMSYDRDYIHNFDVKLSSGKVIRNGVRLVPSNDATKEKMKDVHQVCGSIPEIEKISARTVEEAISKASGKNFWMINPDLEETSSITKDFYPDLYETGPTHMWKFSGRDGEKDLGYGGVVLSNLDYHKDNIIFHDEFVSRIPEKSNIKKYYTRDTYTAYKRASRETFYWAIDTVVQLVDTFDFDFYPDIFSINNVFAFKSEGGEESGVYLVNRPHLASFNPSEEDFSFDRFKNIVRVDEVASRVIAHPVFYFDEGMYKSNTEKYIKDKTVTVLSGSLEDTYQEAARLTDTGYFWAIDNDVDVLTDFDRSLYIDRHHKSHFHIWPKINPGTGFIHQYGGLKLIPAEAIKSIKPDSDKIRKMKFKNKKPIKSETIKTRDIPYDVIMLSYREPEADANYAKLLEKVPNAKRVHGVKGIFNAHQRASEIADTRMFYVIDADAILLDDFEFEYFPTVWDEDTVHVWKSRNPINGLVYGFGGLKLFPTQLLRDAKEWRIDFTTSISEKFKPMPSEANYTAFNTNPYDTWKSAFRECTKLSSSVIHRSKQGETDERLEIWCTVNNDAEFGEYAIAGANAGREYGTKHAGDDDALSKINDYDWLKDMFEENTNEKK